MPSGYKDIEAKAYVRWPKRTFFAFSNEKSNSGNNVINDAHTRLASVIAAGDHSPPAMTDGAAAVSDHRRR